MRSLGKVGSYCNDRIMEISNSLEKPEIKADKLECERRVGKILAYLDVVNKTISLIKEEGQ